MKKLLTITALLITISMTLFQQAAAQGFLDRMKQKAKDKLNQRADKKTDKAMDKTLDQADSAASGTTKSKTAGPNQPAQKQATMTSYKNYDFIPGDQIIFESQLADERSGEIPSQFTVNEGQVDIQTEDGENVIHVPKGAFAQFAPRLKNAGALPAQFTIEFDYKNEKYGLGHVNVNFGYHVNTYGPDDVLQGVGFDDVRLVWTLGQVNYPAALVNATGSAGQWHHYAIAVNGDVGKAYIDQYRVASLNNLKGKPKGIFIEMIGYEDSYIKNVRIAAGGIDAYKKITTDNKIITHGILFEVDHSAILANSMGTINSIYSILAKEPSLKFEIDGHTDNTGTAAHNLTLSQSRAEAVKAQLVSMGIAAERLTVKGFGDSRPLARNDSPEGRANNRRVEFVKLK